MKGKVIIMATKSEIALELLDAVGGKENVDSVTHCATRLRLVLKDKSKYDAKVIDNIEGVQGLIYNAGQLQVIFGLNVPEYYKAFLEVSGVQGKSLEQVKKEQKKQGNLLIRIIKQVPGAVMPALPIMIGGALIAAIANIIKLILTDACGIDGGVVDNNVWYKFFSWDGIGGLFSSYLVIWACINFGKNIGLSKIYAISIGLFLAFAGATGDLVKDLIPDWAPFKRYNSIFVGMFAVWVACKFESWLKPKFKDVGQSFVIPLVVLTIPILLTMLIFGPIINWIEWAMAWLLEHAVMNKHLYGLGLGIFAGLFGPMVVMGVHHSFTPIRVQNLEKDGFERTWPADVVFNISQAGAALAVGLRTKDKKLKAMALSSAGVCFLGISEPAMFGVNLRNKKYFLWGCLGAFLGGWYCGFMQVAFTGNAGLNGIFAVLVTVPSAATPQLDIWNVVNMLIGVVIAAAVPFLGVFLTFSNKEKTKESKVAQFFKPVKVWYTNTRTKMDESKFANGYRNMKQKSKDMCTYQYWNERNYKKLPKLGKVNSPAQGKFVELKNVNDPTFASGTMGNGFAIEPSIGYVVAPFNGEVTMVFETQHAIGLKSNDGVEVLIHIGIDTVNLGGDGFKAKVKVGQKVKAGKKLIKFNMKKIKNKNYQTIIPVIVTNVGDGFDEMVINKSKQNVEFNNEIITMRK